MNFVSIYIMIDFVQNKFQIVSWLWVNKYKILNKIAGSCLKRESHIKLKKKRFFMLFEIQTKEEFEKLEIPIPYEEYVLNF